MEPELEQGAIKQGARIGAGSQYWSRVPELEQGKNWSRLLEMGQGVRTGGGRQNWSQVILGVEAELQETAILPTS